MRQKPVLLLFAILVMSVLNACTPGVIVPQHLTSAPTNLHDYKNVQIRDVRQLDPFPDSTPQYNIKITTGSHNTIGGQSVVDHIYARTNGDTKGLELLSDGSNRYTITVGRFNGSGYLVTNVESELGIKKRAEERRLEAQEKKAAEAKKLQEERDAMIARHCGSVGGEEYFCFDDNNKLAEHDVDSLAAVLKKLTSQMLNDSGYARHRGNPGESGQWYVERVTPQSVSVTITRYAGDRKELVGETVLDKKVKAGTAFYFERTPYVPKEPAKEQTQKTAAPAPQSSADADAKIAKSAASWRRHTCYEKCGIDKSARESNCRSMSIQDAMIRGSECFQQAKRYFDNCESACSY